MGVKPRQPRLSAPLGPPFRSAAPRAGLGSSPRGPGRRAWEGSCKRKTFQMQQIAEEKAREVRGVWGGVCVYVCACVRLHQTCKPATCLRPAVLSVIKTRRIRFEQGSQKENSDEEVNTKNLLSKALEGGQCLVLLVHRRTTLTDDSSALG